MVGLEHLPCEGSLEEVGLFTLEPGLLWGHLTALSQALHSGAGQKDRNKQV